VDDALAQEGVQGGHRRRFHGRGVAREQRRQRHHRDEQLPLGGPDRRPGLAPIDETAARFDLRSLAHPPPGRQDHQQDARSHAAEEDLLDGDVGLGAGVGHDDIEDRRQTRRKQEPERTGAGKQAQRGTLAVTGGEQHGHEQAAQGQDRHARGAGERGEEGADQHGHQRRSAAEPAHQGLEHPDQPPRCATFGKEIPGQREQRNAGQGGIGHQPVMLQRDGEGGLTLSPEQDEGGAAQGGEHGGAQQDGEAQQHQRRHHELLGLERQPDGQRRQAGSQRAGDEALPPSGAGVPDQAERHQGEAHRQHELDDPHRDPVHQHLGQRAHCLGVLEAGDAQEQGDRRRDAAADEPGRGFGATAQKGGDGGQ